MVVSARDVETVDVGWDDAGDEEEAVYQRVGVGAREEEDGEGGKEDVDEGEAEAGEHFGSVVREEDGLGRRFMM